MTPACGAAALSFDPIIRASLGMVAYSAICSPVTFRFILWAVLLQQKRVEACYAHVLQKDAQVCTRFNSHAWVSVVGFFITDVVFDVCATTTLAYITLLLQKGGGGGVRFFVK